MRLGWWSELSHHNTRITLTLMPGNFPLGPTHGPRSRDAFKRGARRHTRQKRIISGIRCQDAKLINVTPQHGPQDLRPSVAHLMLDTCWDRPSNPDLIRFHRLQILR